jgi:hypothetical protein
MSSGLSRCLVSLSATTRTVRRVTGSVAKVGAGDSRASDKLSSLSASTWTTNLYWLLLRSLPRATPVLAQTLLRFSGASMSFGSTFASMVAGDH